MENMTNEEASVAKKESLLITGVIFGIIVMLTIIQLLLMLGGYVIESAHTENSVAYMLGYSNWILASADNPIMKYISTRIWHIAPLLFSSASLILLFKVMVTGKCLFFKNLTFFKISIWNMAVYFLFFPPMLIEIVIVISIGILFLYQIIKTAYKTLIFTINRFDNACSYKNKESS